MSDTKLIVCGFPGIGKTFACKKYGWADSDSSSFSWESEGVRHKDWPGNYIDHLRSSKGIILVSTHGEVRDGLHFAGLPFTLCYPSPECKYEYINRYIERGSPPEFIKMLLEKWDYWIAEMKNERRASGHIILNPRQYVSDLHAILWEQYASQ